MFQRDLCAVDPVPLSDYHTDDYDSREPILAWLVYHWHHNNDSLSQRRHHAFQSGLGNQGILGQT